MPDPTAAIEVHGLRKSFGGLEVLRGVDLRMDRGTVLGLLGPNGAGKTTVVRILSTLLAPDGGSALVNGHDVLTHPHRVRGSIGLTGQFAAVDELLTGWENLVMMGRLFRAGKPTARRRAAELLEQFELTEAAQRKVKTYAGGMRRRLDLAVSLISAPPVIFLDEPTTGLDPRSRLTMWEAIGKLLADGVSILLTTQYLEEADRLADRIAVIDEGLIIAEGTADTLKRQVGGERLTLTFSDTERFEAARRLVACDDPLLDPRDRSISLAIADSRQVKHLLDRMELGGVEIDSIALAKPTLDDVFLTLTGHPAEADAEEAVK